MVTSDVDYWLEQLRHRRWSLYFFGPERHHPQAMAATFGWDWAVDVILIHAEDYAVAWRVPLFTVDTNPFAPEQVTWWYAATTNRTLRAALTLDPPGQERHPIRLEPAPTHCRVPDRYRHDLTFRPGPGEPVVLYTPGPLSG
ncbi:MAG TPA: hypothetical protein VFV67_04975 [Actinophytocola sp.]|uniref:hypothetical protein n=1 Tax=Actinophytocola sp. TaxID=1872138 RepID=UPI002DB67055|nr:hypothetical protein [Actinophytocola sp.]HEU5469984.1 hypothetical protein [Actinophytocola sp.]